MLTRLHNYWRSIPVLRSGIDGLDKLSLVASGALLAVGLIAIYSATITNAAGQLAWAFLLKQLFHAAIGIGIGVVLWKLLPLAVLRQYSLALAALAVGSLLLVHLPVLGVATDKGAARWITLGVATVQPVEFTKVLVLVYACSYCAAMRDSLSTFRGFAQPLMVVLVADVFLLLQPDFGSAVLITVLVLAVMFMAGTNLWLFVVAGGLGAAAAGMLIVAAPYRMQRLLAFADPFGDPLGSGYHQTHSLMAFGRGGWVGRGLGQSVEKWSHLPEAHTDFIISVLAEETGFWGFTVVILLYSIIMTRAFVIAANAEKNGRFFSALLARAIGLLLVVQMFINIGSNLSLLPVKGLTLPLLSYGGSSVVAWLVSIALLQILAYENISSKNSQLTRLTRA